MKLFNFIGGFFTSTSNESQKRLIAFMFSITIIVLAFNVNSIKILEQIIYGMLALIALLLGLTTIENLVNIFKKGN
jgi:hypothetical protein